MPRELQAPKLRGVWVSVPDPNGPTIRKLRHSTYSFLKLVRHSAKALDAFEGCIRTGAGRRQLAAWAGPSGAGRVCGGDVKGCEAL